MTVILFRYLFIHHLEVLLTYVWVQFLPLSKIEWFSNLVYHMQDIFVSIIIFNTSVYSDTHEILVDFYIRP